MEHKFYITKVKVLTGTSYGEVYTKAKFIYKTITSRTKRRPYIRSIFFNKEKIFLDVFWTHLSEKNHSDRFRRLKQYPCGLDLIKNSKMGPTTQESKDKSSEVLHRFYGINGNGESFIVQIKENINNGEKNFMSVLPLH